MAVAIKDLPLCKALHNGKSHLAIALGTTACQNGHTAYFTTFHNMIEELRTAYKQNRFRRKLLKYSKPRLLMNEKIENTFKKLREMEANHIEIITERINQAATEYRIFSY